MNNKKGLSDVVATVLIILLALAAIAIIWAFIQPSVSSAGSAAELQNKCLTVEVEPVDCTYNAITGPGQPVVAAPIVTYKLTRGSPADLEEVIAIVGSTTGTTKTSVGPVPGQTLATEDVAFSGVEQVITFNPSNGESIYSKAAAVVSDGEGNTATCPQSIKSVSCRQA